MRPALKIKYALPFAAAAGRAAGGRGRLIRDAEEGERKRDDDGDDGGGGGWCVGRGGGEGMVVVITGEHVGARGAARKGCEIGQRVVI